MFIYRQWEEFCSKLEVHGFTSVPAASLIKDSPTKPYIVLKHDVETNPSKALRLAQIESEHSHKGTYYVQAYLMRSRRNADIFKQIQQLGHEVSYHHDVMDSNKGDIDKAREEFQSNLELFEGNGFQIETVCQHGNPVIERSGYSSNRDFFRDKQIAQQYKHISEIMVNFRSRIEDDYIYISDAGYGWKIIFDPENNDIIKSDDKNTSLVDLNDIIDLLENQNSVIVSTHPHRWQAHVFSARAKDTAFKLIKKTVKELIKMPYMKKWMGKFYYLAKKI